MSGPVGAFRAALRSVSGGRVVGAEGAEALRAAGGALADAASRAEGGARVCASLVTFVREVDGLERAPDDLAAVLLARGQRLAALAACVLPPEKDEGASPRPTGRGASPRPT
ncbi:MAG: hypothetical protein AABZ30_10605, partial [Myxococcota bacterium]